MESKQLDQGLYIRTPYYRTRQDRINTFETESYGATTHESFYPPVSLVPVAPQSTLPAIDLLTPSTTPSQANIPASRTRSNPEMLETTYQENSQTNMHRPFPHPAKGHCFMRDV